VYETSSLIEMHARRPRILSGEGAILEDRASQWNASASIINTRLEKLGGVGTYERVIQHLKGQGDSQAENTAPAAFKLIKDSYLVRITCRHNDPERVAVSANAFAEVTQLLAFEENKIDSDNAVAWMETQAATQKKVLEDAGKALVDFRSRNKLDILESKKETAADKVLALNQELVAIRSQEVQAKDFYAAIEAGTLPPATPGADICEQRIAEWRAAMTARDALLVKYRAGHPKILAAVEAIAVRRAEAKKAVDQARAAARSRLDLLGEQAGSIEIEVEKARAQSAEFDLQLLNMNVEFESLERAKASAEITYTGILRRIEDARRSADENTTTVKIVEKALIPKFPVYPKVGMMLTLGLLLGLGCGVGVSFLREVFDDLIGSSRDIEETLGLRILGLVPYRKDAVRKELAKASMREGSHVITEAFATIRGLLCSPQYREKTTSLLITGTAPAEGKTVIACNLAITFARSGVKTLLVDFDLRRPRIERIFSEIKDAEALLDILKMEKPDIADFCRLPCSTECNNLDVIISRADHSSTPAEVMGTPVIQHFMRWAKETYDQVIFDCPPHGLLGDAGVLASQVGGVIVVCRANKSRRHSLRQAAQYFGDIGANVLGVVVSAVKFGTGGYFNSSSYYHNDYYQPKYYVPEEAPGVGE
jgi:capsular exopolysaccharide synthesis family protein